MGVINLESNTRQVYFDGAYLGNKSGIGRDARNFLIAAEKVFGSELAIIYPKLRIFSRNVLICNTSTKSPMQKILKLFSSIFNSPNYCNLPENSVFIQSHLNSVLPLRSQSIRHIVRLHDLFPITNPEWFKNYSKKIFEIGFRNACREASFICDSETTRSALISLSNETSSRSSVAYCPVANLQDIPCGKCLGCELTLIPNQYILTVGTLEPRKNYDELLEAWTMSKIYQTENVFLYIIGGSGWKSRQVKKRIQKDRSKNVRWIKDSCDGSLGNLMRAAKFIVSTSKAEGFNLPISEALALGKHVLISNNAVHVELYGKIAKFYKLGNIENLSLQFQNAFYEKNYFPPVKAAHLDILDFNNSISVLSTKIREMIKDH